MLNAEIEVTIDKFISIMPENEFEEIAQNVRMIITTLKKQVPLDRGFGLDSALVDMPINVAQVRMTANIVTAVNEFEPRVKVKKVNFSGDGVEGLVVASVIVEIIESKLRGGLQ